MNKKRILYAILSVLLVSVIFLGLSIFRDFLSETAAEPEVAKNDGPPSVRWDGKLYQAGRIELDEERVLPDILGKVTELLDLSRVPMKNGQSNALPVGTEIHPTRMGSVLAAYVDGKWIYLRYVPE